MTEVQTPFYRARGKNPKKIDDMKIALKMAHRLDKALELIDTRNHSLIRKALRMGELERDLKHNAKQAAAKQVNRENYDTELCVIVAAYNDAAELIQDSEVQEALGNKYESLTRGLGL